MNNKYFTLKKYYIFLYYDKVIFLIIYSIFFFQFLYLKLLKTFKINNIYKTNY